VKKPTAIDLFSGCGGLTLGLRQANFRVVGAVEIDPLAVETYQANHPRVALWSKDIRGLPVSEVMRILKLRRGQLDLLAGCPPCQGFSRMRTRNGQRAMRYPHNELIRDFARFVRKLMPKTVMLENVPGLKGHWRFKKLCRMLRRLKYDVNCDVRNAADFGVAQRRQRLIMVASRVGDISLPRPRKVKKTVRDAILGLPRAGTSGDPIHDFPEYRAPHIRAKIARIPADGGSRTDLPPGDQLPCHRRCVGFKDVYGRMAWDDVAPTITGGCFNPSKGRFLHPYENRAITMREAALLQGFPAKYSFPIAGKQAIAQMIGNALPPPFIRTHARPISARLTRLKRGAKR
jgi:DNA (cytosine-5)-methyltransferase 1